jgi:hypothetical protein
MPSTLDRAGSSSSARPSSSARSRRAAGPCSTSSMRSRPPGHRRALKSPRAAPIEEGGSQSRAAPARGEHEHAMGPHGRGDALAQLDRGAIVESLAIVEHAAREPGTGNGPPSSATARCPRSRPRAQRASEPRSRGTRLAMIMSAAPSSKRRPRTAPGHREQRHGPFDARRSATEHSVTQLRVRETCPHDRSS